MARNKKEVAQPATENVQTDPVDETVAETVTAPTRADRLATLRAEIDALVKEYNDAAEFGEKRRMQKLDKDTDDKVKEYNAECEAECFAKLLAAEDPMKAAALELTFAGISTKDPKNEDRKVVDVTLRINPLRLHKKSKDTKNVGIGHDDLWWAKSERLNMLFTASVATKLSAADKSGTKLDFTRIKDTIAMKEESAKLTATEEDARDDHILASVQDCLTAMIGEEFQATTQMVEYLRNCHTNAGRAKMTVKVNNKTIFARSMLECCNAALTGNSFILDYRMKKN